LPREEVDRLFEDLRQRFPGAVIAFDVLGAWDFKQTRNGALSVGAEILWMVEPPFERIYGELGLELVPGFDPSRMMNEAIDLYFSRAPWLEQWMLKKLAGVKSLAGKRSGTVFGRLG
jgi:hypothetical protein